MVAYLWRGLHNGSIFIKCLPWLGLAPLEVISSGLLSQHLRALCSETIIALTRCRVEQQEGVSWEEHRSQKSFIRLPAQSRPCRHPFSASFMPIRRRQHRFGATRGCCANGGKSGRPGRGSARQRRRRPARFNDGSAQCSTNGDVTLTLFVARSVRDHQLRSAWTAAVSTSCTAE